MVEFLGSLMYAIISSSNYDSLIFCFSTCIPLIFFSCLTALAKILSTMSRYGETGQSSLSENILVVLLWGQGVECGGLNRNGPHRRIECSALRE